VRARPALFLIVVITLAGLVGCTAAWSGSASVALDLDPLLQLQRTTALMPLEPQPTPPTPAMHKGT